MNDSIENQIETLQEECESLYEKISNNQERINQVLSAFSVGKTYQDGDVPQEGLIIPGNSSDYDQAITILQDDLEDMKSFIEKQKLLKQESMNTNRATINNSYNFEEIAHEFEILKEEREDVILRLSNTRDILDTIPAALENTNEAHTRNTNNYASNTNTNSISSNQNYSHKSDFHSVINFPDYSELSMESTKSTIDQLEQNMSSLLSYIAPDGTPVGGDVYNIQDFVSNGDFNVNFGALQLSLEYIYQDIAVTKKYIEDLKKKIQENKEEINILEEKMKEVKTVTDYDENGNVIRTHTVPAYDREALLRQINVLQQENANYEKEQKYYEQRVVDKQNVMMKLINIRNSYNQAYPELINVFTASDFVDEIRKVGPNGDLYGVPLTGEVKKNLFGVLYDTLNSNKDKYTLIQNGDFDVEKGDFSFDLFHDILSSCRILGNSKNTFENNYLEYQDSLVLVEAYVNEDGYIVFSQNGYYDENGNWIDEGWDEKFKEDGYSSFWSKSIKESGCSVAASATVVSNLLKRYVTPPEIKALYHSDGANEGNKFAQDVFDSYGLDYVRGLSFSKNMADNDGNLLFDNVLENHGAIIYNVKLFNDKGNYISDHYMAIVDIRVNDNGKKEYYVVDSMKQTPGEWVELSPSKSEIRTPIAIAPEGMTIEEAMTKDPDHNDYSGPILDSDNPHQFEKDKYNYLYV